MSYQQPSGPLIPLQHPAFNPSTPPAPPPKTLAQHPNMQSSIQYPPALPPHPQQYPSSQAQAQWQDGNSGVGVSSSQYTEGEGRYESGAELGGQHYQAQMALPEEGWVPEILLDKSYVSVAPHCYGAHDLN